MFLNCSGILIRSLAVRFMHIKYREMASRLDCRKAISAAMPACLDEKLFLVPVNRILVDLFLAADIDRFLVVCFLRAGSSKV